MHGRFHICDGCGYTFHLIVEHLLTAVLESFSFLLYDGLDVVGFGAHLVHGVFHGFGRLIAQCDAFLLDAVARLKSRLTRVRVWVPIVTF